MKCSYSYSTKFASLCCICLSLLMAAQAFAPKSLVARCNSNNGRCLGDTSTTALSMAQNNDDLLRWARSSRSAGSEDNVVELLRPLGLVLNADDNGNVYVETVAPKGNAARTGKVRFMFFFFVP